MYPQPLPFSARVGSLNLPLSRVHQCSPNHETV
jgi:hypothetical protein